MGQSLVWGTHVDTSTTFSSPRAVDLTLDGTKDIVIGGGLDGSPEDRGVAAIDGTNGALLWTFHTNDEIFGSAQFMDITGDNIPEVFIGGRYAEFYAINGATGAMEWEFFSSPSTQALDSGWFNFYSPQFIPDQNSDGVMDILVANGGNHSLPPWDTLRDPGMLMVLDATTGAILAKDTMPDGEETYCSAVVHDFGSGLEIIFGSGGENDGGSLWRVPLVDLMANDISGATLLATNPDKGYVAPPSLADVTWDGITDIIAQCYDGEIQLFDGSSNALIWEVKIPGTESSAAPVIGDFIGSKHPDVYAVLGQGAAPSFFDYYQIMIDGQTGQIAWIDSLSNLNFCSANAVDLDLNGRDEVVASLNFHNGSYFEHQLYTIDFQNDIVSPFYIAEAGVNLGSTPLIDDMDNDGMLDFVFAYRADSVNPMGAKGYDIRRLESTHTIPGTGIAWGGYMGSNWDGEYTFNFTNCGTINLNATMTNISCNGFDDGVAQVAPTGGTAPYNYVWSNGEIGAMVDSLPVGMIELLVVDANGCAVQHSFNMFDPYVITFGGIVTPTCPGDTNGSVQVNSSGCPCMFSGCLFDWSSGDSTKQASNLSAGWHTVTITHTDGCIVVDSVEVPEAYPIVDSSMVVDHNCATSTTGSGEIILHLHNESQTTLTWNTGGTNDTLSSLFDGQYYVDLTDTRGCSATDTFYVTVPDTIDIDFTATDLLCNDDSSGVIDATVNGGLPNYAYQWSNGGTTSNLSNLHAGTHVLTITDSVGCIAMDSIELIEPTPITSSITFSHDFTGLCDGEAEAIAGGGTPNYTYNWSPSSASTANATGLCAGIHIVTITDANGCTHQDTVEILSTVGVDDNTTFELFVYPNPAISSLQIETNSKTTIDYRIYNAAGQITNTGNFNGNTFVDVSHLANGVYFLELNSDEGVIRKKLSIRK